MESNRLEITIRELPEEDYEEIVIPVVFHVLVPPATAAPAYDLSVEFLEEQLQRVSDAFNRKITTDLMQETLKSCLSWQLMIKMD